MLITAMAALAFSSQMGEQFLRWGRETLQTIDSHYKLPNSALYSDAFDLDSSNRSPSFNWGVGVWLSALNAAGETSRVEARKAEAYAIGVDAYWIETPPVPGYDVLPNATSVDRYYDDNEWMALSLCQSYQVSRNKSILDRALLTLKFVLSGEDAELGGGIYWRENEKKSKNTCSNGPAAAACLAVYDATKDAQYLTKAISLYDWTRAHLQDPSDNLFWDNVSLNGTIQKSKWSYNTALMIRSAAELFKATKDEKYKDQARQMVDSSYSHWFDAEKGTIKDGGRFAHLLLEAWLRAAGDGCLTSDGTAKIKEAVAKTLAYVHQNCQVNGNYGGNWAQPVDPHAHRFELIDQASVARAYLVAAGVK